MVIEPGKCPRCASAVAEGAAHECVSEFMGFPVTSYSRPTGRAFEVVTVVPVVVKKDA